MIPQFIKVRTRDINGHEFEMVINTALISCITKQEKGTAYIRLVDREKTLDTLDSYDSLVRVLEPTSIIANEQPAGTIDLSNNFDKMFKEYSEEHPGLSEQMFIYKYLDMITPNIKAMYPNIKWTDKTCAFVAYCKTKGINWESSL